MLKYKFCLSKSQKKTLQNARHHTRIRNETFHFIVEYMGCKIYTKLDRDNLGNIKT